MKRMIATVALVVLMLAGASMGALAAELGQLNVYVDGCSSKGVNSVSVTALRLEKAAGIEAELPLSHSGAEFPLRLRQGSYSINLSYGQCAARFRAVVVGGVARAINVHMRMGVSQATRPNKSKPPDEVDVYTPAEPGLAGEWPSPGIAATLSYSDGTVVPAKMDGRWFFFDRVPPGEAILRIEGSNWRRSIRLSVPKSDGLRFVCNVGLCATPSAVDPGRLGLVAP